jgi:hypothetical protein
MADNKQLQQVNEAAGAMVTSLRETSQAIANSVITIQDHNLRFTQDFFSNWMELLTYDMESAQQLQQQLGKQIQKLVPASMWNYMDFLRAPRRISHQAAEIPKAPVNPIQVEKFLKGIDYPVSKADLIKYAQQHGADENVCAALEQLHDQTFNGPVDVSKAIGEINRKGQESGFFGRTKKEELFRGATHEPAARHCA